MKKQILRICIVTVAIALILSAFTFSITSSAEDNSVYYGRSSLALLDNGERLVKVYDHIVERIEERDEHISLWGLPISVDELSLVMEAYFNDPHGHFWVENGYTYGYYILTSIVSHVKPIYNDLAGSSRSELSQNRAVFDSTVEGIITDAGVTEAMSEYEKELRLHDAVVKKVTYVDGDHAHTPYGALVEGKAICHGYALAFEYLLAKAGIQSYTVKGMAGEDRHSWSLVRIDGDYCYTDITWDDSGDDSPVPEHNVFYSYFNLSDSQLALDHQLFDTKIALPECNADVTDYYSEHLEMSVTASPSPEYCADLFDRGMIRLRIVAEDPSAIIDWFRNNAVTLATLTGHDLTKPVEFSYVAIKNEYHLYIDGTLTETDTDTDTEPEAPETENEGTGDLDSSGGIDAKDANTLKQILAGGITPTDAQITAGDLDGDGHLTAKDSNILKRIITGTLQ